MNLYILLNTLLMKPITIIYQDINVVPHIPLEMYFTHQICIKSDTKLVHVFLITRITIINETY